MTLRIIVRTDDAGMAANVGGAVQVRYRTFEIEAPQVEAFIREVDDKRHSYTDRQIVGVELIAASEPQP